MSTRVHDRAESTLAIARPSHGEGSRASERSAKRIQWIDVARGLGIMLVVAGHAAGGLIDAPGAQAPTELRYAFLAIYTFHMPVFFFLAGLFVAERLERGVTSFLAGLLTTIVYPYFLWSVIQFTVIYALGSWVNHPVDSYSATILALPWRTVSQFWFLHALFLIQLVGIAAWLAGGRYAVLAAALLFKVVTLFAPGTPALSLAGGNAPYYALGVLLGWKNASAIFGASSFSLRVGTIIGAAIVIAILCSVADQLQPVLRVETTSSAGIARIAWMPAMLPATILGGAALLVIANLVAGAGGMVANRLGWIGKMSMPIFLMHILFIAGTRILADRLFGAGTVALLPIMIVIGIAGPVAAKTIADRLALSRILGLA